MKSAWSSGFVGGLVLAILFSGCEKRSEKVIIELNDNWRFKESGKDTLHPALVPGTVHTDLLREGLIDDPFYRDNEIRLQWIGKTDWDYLTRFTVSREILQHENVELVFEGLDTYASVFLNDSLILEADNMFREWRTECKSALHQGENTLRVHFRSPINEVLPRMEKLGYRLPAANDQGEKTSPYTRKAPYHYGWDWGPRLVTCGIWQPVRIEAWNSARVTDLNLVQNRLTEDVAELRADIEIESVREFEATIVLRSPEKSFRTMRRTVRLRPGLQTLAVDFTIDKPELWWPNGLGEQPLYTVEARLSVGDRWSDVATQRFALRTIELWQEEDAYGESFEFVVNGVPVFAKGGNWIPADNFTTRVDRKRYEHLLRSVKDANMNMLRVWGGGIYENDDFYELCDELGIMIWQDFMFACSMYPATPADSANIRAEAVHQVKRLRNHPSIVLWCGNNEVETAWKNWGWQRSLPASLWEDYLKIFHDILPAVCGEYDPSRPYWPSSPSSNLQEAPNAQTSGDMHYWGVWHAAAPFEEYLNQAPRFMSEYGFQSFPQLRSVKRFTLPEDRELESPVMLAHQKNSRGNQLIRRYILREYDEPKDFASFLYVSQVVQAEAIKLGSEHYRRIMPRCMGALYWQINDCWPVASWSSIDYYGSWKALHYYAKKFFEPVLVTAHILDDAIHIYVVSDRTYPVAAQITATLMKFDGEPLRQTTRNVWVRALDSHKYLVLNRAEWLAGQDTAAVFLLAELRSGDKILSSNCIFFAAPGELKLKTPNIDIDLNRSRDGIQISLQADVLARNVYLSTGDLDGGFSNNYFNLLPGRKTDIEFKTEDAVDTKTFEDNLQIMTLLDAFKDKASQPPVVE